MSTRALVGIANDNGTVDYIYNHFDGYIKDGLGQYLKEHVLTEQAVRELIARGDASSIAENIFYNDGSDSSTDYFYIFSGKKGIDYLYLFKDGKWTVKGYEDKAFFEI
jgi:hypothetical protein